MATSLDAIRVATSASRPITDAILDAVRDAVLVFDTQFRHLPLILANAAARRCLCGGNVSALDGDWSGFTLHSLLAVGTDSALEAVLEEASTGKGRGTTRVLSWRFSSGEMRIATELKLLAAGSGHRAVMFSFAEPVAGDTEQTPGGAGPATVDVSDGEQPAVGDAGPPTGDAEAAARDANPAMSDARTTIGDAELMAVAVSDAGLAAGETGSAPSGTGPAAVDMRNAGAAARDAGAAARDAGSVAPEAGLAAVDARETWLSASDAAPSPGVARRAAGDMGDAQSAARQPWDLMILDKELTVTYASAGAARTAGGSLSGVLNYSALTLMPTSAVPRRAFTRALLGDPYHHECTAVSMPGEPTRWFEIHVQPLRSGLGIVGVAVQSMDVSLRRGAARPDFGTEDRLRMLTENARDLILVAGVDGTLLYVSGGVTQALGYTPAERRSNSLFEFVHPEDVEELRSLYGKLAQQEEAHFSHQYRVRHKDGTYRWLESTYVSALTNPLINGVVVNARDVSERKHAEMRLQQREEVFDQVADAVQGIVFEWDFDRNLVRRSRGVFDVLGIEPEQLERVGAWRARVHPEDLAEYNRKLDVALLQGGLGWTAEYRIRDARGRYRSILERGVLQHDARGAAVRAFGCGVDVSEIKRLSVLLAETQRAARIGGWEYSYATRELEWTDEMFRIFETDRAQFVVSWDAMLALCTMESRRRLEAAVAAAEACAAGAGATASAATGRWELDLEMITLKERRIWVRLIGHLEKLEGLPFRAVGSLQNIQSQKLAQIALENRTDWLKLSMNMAHLHAWRWRRAGDSLEFAIVDGQPRALPGMKKFLRRVHPKDRSVVRQAIAHAFEHRTEVQEEFRLKSHHGRYRAYCALARPLFDAANQPSGLVGVTQDVTARRDADARWRRSEALLRTTTANTADTLLLLDIELRIRYINRGALGLGIGAIVGRSIADVLPGHVRAGVVSQLNQVLASAQPASFEFHVEAADGAREYFDNRAVLVRDEGIGTGISITMRDVTERKRLEREVLAASSRERQTIGRDLHDGLGQELTGVALMLRALATKLSAHNPQTSEQVDDVIALVNQSIETARTLAHGLLPVHTDGGGLPEALRTLAERNRDLHGLEVKFRAEAAPESTLNEISASHLYRIAQEVLTNTARHAHATEVDMFLAIEPTRFVLRIADNGIGLENAVRPGLGMGLKIMKYRAGVIGATLEIASVRPHGTVIRVAGPQSALTTASTSVEAI